MFKSLLFLLAVLIPESQPTDQISLSVSLAWKIGETRRVSVTGTTASKALIMNWDHSVREAQRKMNVDLVAIERALATDSAGKITRARLTVEHFTLDGTELCKPGTTIDLGPPPFTIDGHPADANIERSLEYLATSTLIGTSAGDYDAVVGTSKPRHIGEQWPLNRRAIASLIAAKGYQAKAEDITGDAKLFGGQVDGEFELRSTASVQKTIGTVGGMTILDGTMSNSFSVELAKDHNVVGPVVWDLHSKSHLCTAGMAKDGHPFTMEITDEHKLTSRILANAPATQPVR